MEMMENTIYKETEIGLIPEDWEVVRLGDVIDVETGRRMKGGGLKTGDVVSLGCEHIKENGNIVLKNLKFISKDFYKKLKKGKLKENDVIICKDGARTGKVSYIKKLPFEKIAVNEHIFILRSNVKRLDNYFLFFSILSNIVQFQIKNAYHGLIGGINRKDLAEFKIPLPPLPEQKSIATVLDKIRQAIEQTEEVIKATKELKKSLMKHLFTYGVVPLDEIDKVKLKETEIGLTPEDWEVREFEDLIQRKRVKVGKIKQKNYKEFGKYPIIDQSQKLISGYWDKEDDVYKGTLPIIIFGDHTRIFKYIDFSFILGADGAKIIIPNYDIIYPKYFYFALLNLKIPSRGYNRHYSLLKEFKIPLPPLPEQKAIAEILSKIDQKIEAEENKKQALEQLFKTLLNNLMTGKIRLDKNFIKKFEEI